MKDSRHESLELLFEVGRMLSSKLDVGEMLRTVVESSCRVVGSERASLFLLDEKDQELYFDVALGLGEAASKTRLPVGEGIVGSVAKARKSSIINDVRADPRWSPKVDALTGFKTVSILAVPMIYQDRLIGVVEAINKKEGRFTDADVSAFEAFASQAAVSIVNARLFSSLAEERRKLQAVFTQMTDGALLAGSRGEILLANESSHRLTGAKSPTALGEAFAGLTLKPSIAEVLEGTESDYDFDAVRVEPQPLILSGKATYIRLASGEHIASRKTQSEDDAGWLFVFRDVTEDRSKEKLKRNFLSLISHKLRTPLFSITGFASLLLEELDKPATPPMQLKAAQTIARQGKKLADLVDKLLSYITLDDPEFSVNLAPCPLNDVIKDAVTSLSEWLEEQKAEVSAPFTDKAAVADKVLIQKVLRNLIENGVKFNTSEKKMVSVAVEEIGGRTIISVKDNGAGIPHEDKGKIFSQFHQVDPSFTGQIEGWGLGLPFVKKVVDQHHGRLTFESKLGEGTTVTISLPSASA